MKHVCINCHFLSKSYRTDDGNVFVFSLSKDERDQVHQKKIDFIRDMYTLNCHMGVWDEGCNPEAKDRMYRLKKLSRKEKCFFYAFDANMLFNAAKELEKREKEYSRMQKSNMYTRIGLWIASGALFANALIGIIRLYNDY